MITSRPSTVASTPTAALPLPVSKSRARHGVQSDKAQWDGTQWDGTQRDGTQRKMAPSAGRARHLRGKEAFLRGVVDVLRDPSTYAMVAVGALTFGRVSKALLGPLHHTALGLAAGPTLAGFGRFAASVAVDGAAFHTTMNVFEIARGHSERARWKPSDYATSIALVEGLAFSKALHVARLLRHMPLCRMQKTGLALRHLLEEALAVVGVGVGAQAIKDRGFDNAPDSLKDALQFLVATRVLAGVHASVNAGVRHVQARRVGARGYSEATIARQDADRAHKVLDELTSEFEGLPREVLQNQRAERPARTEQHFDGELRLMTISQINKGTVDLKALQRRLTEAFRARRVPLVATVAGSGIDIHNPEAGKHHALMRFSRMHHADIDEIYKFGDKAQPGEADFGLLSGKRAFNVGTGRPAPNVTNTEAKFADGFAEVLSKTRPEEVRWIATDCDETLTTRRDARDLGAGARAQLVRYLNAGTKVMVVSARGPAIVELVVPDLVAYGLTPEGFGNLLFGLYNGAIFRPAAAFLPTRLGF